ncbi:MAG: hypothetical protein ACRC6X_03750 [Culicoidibacterales bacterium]
MADARAEEQRLEQMSAKEREKALQEEYAKSLLSMTEAMLRTNYFRLMWTKTLPVFSV